MVGIEEGLRYVSVKRGEASGSVGQESRVSSARAAKSALGAVPNPAPLAAPFAGPVGHASACHHALALMMPLSFSCRTMHLHKPLGPEF